MKIHTCVLAVLLIVLLPGAASAQVGWAGILGGKTAAQLPQEMRHVGAMAGAFFQVEFSPHVGIRSEATWTRSGAMSRMDLNGCHDCLRQPTAVDLDFLEVNAMGRLSWATTRFQPPDARLGLTVFGGGWLGARAHGQVVEGGNRVGDFGHLLGVGVFWKYHRWMMEASVRSYHGERGLTPGGPRRRGSQLVLGLGYRIHPGGER